MTIHSLRHEHRCGLAAADAIPHLLTTTMEHAVAIFALVHLVILGASHIVRRDAWAEFFIALSAQGGPASSATDF
jgi:hypothetical protein